MEIIVKKNASHSMFRPHYNSSMGKKYYTKDDYMSDLKKHGLEPYNPKDVKPYKRKEYKPSAWARSMVRNIQHDKHGKPIVGDRYWDEINRRGVVSHAKAKKMKLDLRSKINNMEGGFID